MHSSGPFPLRLILAISQFLTAIKMAMSLEIQVSAVDYASSPEIYHYIRALKWTISHTIKQFLPVFNRNVNKFWFSQIGTLFPSYFVFIFMNNTGPRHALHKESAHTVGFSYGKFVEDLDEGQINVYWSLYKQEINLVRGILLL